MEHSLTLSDEEKEKFSSAIIDSIKLIAEASEAGESNNYPVITELCCLYQKLNS